MLSLVPTWIKLSAGAAIAVAVAYGAGQYQGRVAATANTKAKAARQALERIQQLEKNNEQFNSLDARGRCLLFARDSGLSVDICD